MNEVLKATKESNLIVSEAELAGHQPAIDAYLLLRRTHDMVARYVEGELNDHGTSSAQYGVLVNIHRFGPCSLSDLGTKLFRTSGNVTTLVDRMEADGLVERMDHPEDRRVTLVRLTEKGARLLQGLRSQHRLFLSDLMGCLADEDLLQLNRLLEKLRVQLEELLRS